MDLFTHSVPQIAIAITIGSSSLMVICWSFKPGGQWYWNHAARQYAPHPQEPDASDVIMISGLLRRRLCIIDKPFQCSMKDAHQKMSERASTLSLTKELEERWCADFRASMRRRINVRPERTTTLASCSWPTRDSRSLFFTDLRWVHCWSRDLSRMSLWCGSRNSSLSVSNSTPRKMMHVVGPSCLSIAVGRPRISQVLMRVDKFLLHSSDFGAPEVIKSSK